MTWPRGREIVALAAVGATTGILSGLFGVGGGVVLVPILVLLFRYDQRLAAGTSLASIVPSAAVGAITYGIHGSIDWFAAIVLSAAAIGGAQLGTWLSPRLPVGILRWGFVGFMVLVIVSLFLVIPSRDAVLDVTPLVVCGLVVLGVFTGVLSGLLGVGGGVIIVPALMLVFGMSDLAAKGTSLLMMIPAALSGTVGNLRRGSVNVPAAIIIGVAASISITLGAWIATLVDPFVGNILFAVFLAAIAVQMAIRAVRGRSR